MILSQRALVIFIIFCMLSIQVYIVRANEFTTTDGAISLLDLEACKKGKLSSKWLLILQSELGAHVLIHGYDL